MLFESLVTNKIALVIIVIRKNIWCYIIKMCYLTSDGFNMSHLFIGACICENRSSFWTLFWPIHIYSEPWFWRGVWARSICKFWYLIQMVQKTFLPSYKVSILAIIIGLDLIFSYRHILRLQAGPTFFQQCTLSTNKEIVQIGIFYQVDIDSE